MTRIPLAPRLLAPLALALTLAPSQAGGATDPYDPQRLSTQKAAWPEDEANTEAGRLIYLKRCAMCHGDEGKGDGGSAAYLDPRPRDFSKGIFKFRSTTSGELPTDEDLFRVVSRGLPGTAMPAWGEGVFKLSEEERWQVVWHLKVLGGEDFTDEEFDPYKAVVELPAPPGSTPARIASGQAIFLDESKGGCVKCHGKAGRGNGAEAGTQTDDWGDAILPADLTKGWRFKNGTSVEALYRTFSTGVSGTPMPGYAETLSSEERWDIAYFVRSLIEDLDLSGDRVLVAAARAAIPEDPADPAWDTAKALAVPLLGQVVRAPRHANAAVDLVTVQALYTDTEIAFRLVWNDRSRSTKHEPTDIAALKDTYVPAKTLWERRKRPLRDALQLQFPIKGSAGGELPFFYLGGGPGGPVALWSWQADVEASEGRAWSERVCAGAHKPAADRSDDEQALAGRSAYDDGQYALVVRRPLAPGRAKDVNFAAGAFVPFALQAWDGGHGEEGPLSSISSWQTLRLEAPIPTSAYAGGAGGLLGTLILMGGATALARRSARRSPPDGAQDTSPPEAASSDAQIDGAEAPQEA